MKMRRRAHALICGLLLLSACSGVQSALDPAADQARDIMSVFELMMWVCGIMYLLVLGFLAWALWRGRRRLALMGDAPEALAADRATSRALAGWTGLILVGLTILITASFLVDRRLVQAGPQPLQVKITGAQWWWKVEYIDPLNPNHRLTDANQLHLPLNRPVDIELNAADVIHSFWVPNLHGKEDLIPGRTNHIIITPRRTGYFRGQCAEFCGLQHAKMAIDANVQRPQDFNAWWAQSLTPARPPSTPLQATGKQLFETRACGLCHNIAGSEAHGQVAPDLTHLASRMSLASGTLPYNRSNLAGWIANPQQFKPGSNMPAVPLKPEELNAIVDYLDSLK
jgi:cytochrome c oxidase subunit 2